MKQIPTKKIEVRFHDIAACGRIEDIKTAIAIPTHQRITMRLREP
jgi:hypothetical protein